MRGYEWPGNVREVAMVARQAVVQMQSRGQVEIEVEGQCDGAPIRFVGPAGSASQEEPGLPDP